MNHTAPNRWNSLYEQFLHQWSAEASSVGVLIGCSGGADSVALTRLIDQAFRSQSSSRSPSEPPLIIAHFNHRLRGCESDGDQAFVSRLSESLDRRFICQTSDHHSAGNRDEASLRAQRRAFFVDSAKQAGCRYIAVAHTTDDQAETVLHHALRGTGPAGLSGMKSASAIDADLVLRRPLLHVRRDLIRDALNDLGQPWREDASNHSSLYTRNWIRNEVLPVIRKRLPQADEALTRLASNQSQVLELMTRLSEQWLDAFTNCSSLDDGGIQIQIHRPCGGNLPGSWIHDESLAREPAVVIAACQQLYTNIGFPRGEMKQEHWSLLMDLVLDPNDQGQSQQSRGHLPGRIEIRTNQNVVELFSAKR